MTISRRSRSKLLRDQFTQEPTDCGLKRQVSCLKHKPSMVAGAQEDTPKVVGRYLISVGDTYSDTTNVEYTLSCTQPSKIVANGVGEPYLRAAGHRECL